MRISRLARPVLLAAAAALLLCPALPAQERAGAPAPPPPPRPEDVASEDALLRALYDVISGPPGDSVRDWDRFRSLFSPGARITFAVAHEDGRTTLHEGTVERYVAANAPLMAREGFWEREIHRRVDRFGSLAQVFSTYEYHQGPGTPPERGINSIQLVRADGRWWVVSLVAHPEAAWNRLPEEHLPAGG